MKPIVNIASPCTENLSSMPRCGNTLYCGVCQKNVTDLRRKSTPEIEAFIHENKNACVIVHARHEEKTSAGYTWINSLEKRLINAGWKRTAFAATVIVAFLVSCSSRRKPHVAGKFMVAEKNKRTEQRSTLTE